MSSRGEAALEQAFDRVVETSLPRLLHVQVVDAVDLLGHVGQVEVGGERSDQSDGVDHIDRGQYTGELGTGGVAVFLAQTASQHPNVFDELEEFGAPSWRWID